MTETTQNASNKFTTLNLKSNISMRTYILQIPIDHTVLNRETIKYLWDIRILCPTEQNQKSKCEHTQHKLFKSKWPKQHKCNQQIYNTQSQVQHDHAYLHPANTVRSYSIERRKIKISVRHPNTMRKEQNQKS